MRACTACGPRIARRALPSDALAHYKALYDQHGAGRTNLAYGYVRKSG